MTPLPQAEPGAVEWVSLKRNVMIYDIKRIVCDEFGITEAQLVGTQLAFVKPRHIAFWLARRATRGRMASLPMIARHFGGKDHTTVLHGCRRVAMQRSDPTYRALTDRLEARLICQ